MVVDVGEQNLAPENVSAIAKPELGRDMRHFAPIEPPPAGLWILATVRKV